MPKRMPRVRTLLAGTAIAASVVGTATLGVSATGSQGSSLDNYAWPTQVSQYESMPYRGVNLAGAEYDYEFQAPSVQDGAFYASVGMNTIRLPFKWEYLQSRSSNTKDRVSNPAETIDWSSPNASTYASLVQGYVDHGMHVILDMHNYMRYAGLIIGTPGAATADHYAAAWKSIAAKFANNPLVSFDIMNEPYGMSTTLLVENYNKAIAAIREVADNTLMLEGNGWSGAHSWTHTWPDHEGRLSNADAFTPGNIKDPANNYVINVHQYFDPEYSGMSDCTGAKPNLDTLTAYLRQHNLKAIVTEMGGINTSSCAAATNAFLSTIASQPEYLGFTGWAGGTPGMNMIHYFGPTRDGNGVTVTMSDGFQPHLRRTS